MKKIITIIIASVFATPGFSQNNVKLEDLKTPNSPGFQLLDISPSSIERPTNPKEFSLKLLNHVGEGSLLPKNYAFEFSPFWFGNHKKTKIKNGVRTTVDNVYTYLDLDESTTPKSAVIRTGLWRKFSLSLVSTFADSTSGSLLANTNYVALGGRTNLLTIRSRKQNNNLVKGVLAAAKRMNDLGAIRPDGTRPTADELEKLIDKDQEFLDNINLLRSLPLLQWEVAYAYSHAFKENEFSQDRFNRSGFWTTIAINAPLGKKETTAAGTTKNNNHFISFIGHLKLSKDNVLTDTLAQVFNKKSFTDFGGKIEYNLKRFTVSAEYVSRKYKDVSEVDSDRTAGCFQYKINDNLYVAATFGRNFGDFRNVFTVLGLNWGFGKSSLTDK
jgi:hypothetical protein